MKIALLGYGKMGKAIAEIAISRGHTVSLIVDPVAEVKNIPVLKEFDSGNLQNIDVCIEFSIPSVALSNFGKCFEADVPVVSGTTGWLDKFDEVKNICETKNKGFFYASNFSIGVNIFFAVNKYLSKIMNEYSDYDVALEEIHHTQKLDAPSGTAITLANDIVNNIDRKNKWILNDFKSTDDLQITAKRLGVVPGTHIITYESPVDRIEISHEAKGRTGFAFGAVVAAEFMKGRKGFYGMKDLIKI